MFAVSGPSGSGKTTVVTQLVHALVSRGYRVATLKSSVEDIVPPRHKDTGKHYASGASVVALLGPTTTTVVYRARRHLHDIFRGCDLDFIIVEGAKHSNIPKLWCTGGQTGRGGELPDGVVAVLVWRGDDHLSGVDTPILFSDDTDRLVEMVESEAIDIGLVEL